MNNENRDGLNRSDDGTDDGSKSNALKVKVVELEPLADGAAPPTIRPDFAIVVRGNKNAND